MPWFDGHRSFAPMKRNGKRKHNSAILSLDINKKLKTHKKIPEREDQECVCAGACSRTQLK